MQKNLRALILVIALCLTAQAIPFHAIAQSVVTEVNITITPENPEPFGEVTVELISYLRNLSSAQISWTEDGKVTEAGVGKTIYKFHAKDSGIPTIITAIITFAGGDTQTKRILVVPMGVDLLFEAPDSAVPPLYKGKALPSKEGKLKIVAMPSIKNASGAYTSPDKLLYKWKNNYEDDLEGSGYGKNSYIIDSDFLTSVAHVGLTISSLSGALSASKQADFGFFPPHLYFYPIDPLYGPLFDRALTSEQDITGDDFSIFAMPYFLSPKDLRSKDLNYTWEVNGEEVDNKSYGNVLTLQRGEDNKGDAGVKLNVENSNKLFQSIDKFITLHFR